MKSKKIWLGAILIALLLNGCMVLSFYPLYTRDVLVKDDRILGTWRTGEYHTDDDGKTSFNQNMLWTITFPDSSEIDGKEAPNQFDYYLQTKEVGDTAYTAIFKLHLVKLGKHYFFDFYPIDMELSNDFAGRHLLAMHSFARVKFGKEIHIDWFSEEALNKAIEQQKIRIRHEAKDERVILTASPKELQKFVIKYVEDPEAFHNGESTVMAK